MARLRSACSLAFALVLLCVLSVERAFAQATINNPEVLAVNSGGTPIGTSATQFIFRATVTFGMEGQAPINGGSAVWAVINPTDPANPEAGGLREFPMTRVPNTDTWIAYVTGSQIEGGTPGSINGRTYNWSIRARNNSTGGTFMNGIAAAPKPAAQLRVYASGGIAFTPVDQNFQDDKRGAVGQLGNGLRVHPQESTSPNDGGSSHFYTFRVRVETPGLLPLQFHRQRTNYTWFDPRPEINNVPVEQRWNSGVILVLKSPDGTVHRVPMEIDPDAPGQGGGQVSPLQGTTYPRDASNQRIFRPNATPGQGVYYRYKMMPTMYYPFFFGGPSAPDGLQGQMIGGPFNNEIIGRPFANDYVAFARPDNPLAPSPVFPRRTGTANQAGQWEYYYEATTDFRPVGNGSVGTYVSQGDTAYGSNVNNYFVSRDYDDGRNPFNPFRYYNHPMVDPMLSDGGWTDDLIENNPLQPYLNYNQGGLNGPANRTRLTTRTRARFMARVTRKDNSPLPANAVRVWIDGTPFTMQKLDPADNNFTQGVQYYYDTAFPAGREGQHWTYFEVDDGIHKAIWPRRPSSEADARQPDPQYPDPQFYVRPFAPFIPRDSPVLFGTQVVGRNYINDPYVNNRPTLSNSSVSPASGAESSPFTYEITYTDRDGDEPLDAQVVIDGIPHNMTAVDNASVTTGRRYRFVLTSLNPTPDRVHTYFFRFRDNWAAEQPIRREFGEWVNLPQGDDSGNPSSVIQGPVIIGNNLPELTNPQYFYSDPARTPATLFDFAIRYRDADNDAPQSIKVYISADGGNTYDGGTALVKAENSSNYVAGVQYHLPSRIKLPVGNNYRFKFTANDQAVGGETTLIHVGTGSDSISRNTAQTLVPVNGTPNAYADPTGTEGWFVNPASLFVWRGTGANTTLLVLNDPGPDGYTVDAANGRVILNQATNEPIRASYFYLQAVGPVVNPNKLPLLTPPGSNAADNFQTLTPMFGSPSTSFTYTIIYTDEDNQAPAYVNLVVDTTRVIAMTMDPATPTPVDYTKGVRYTATVAGSTLGIGPHVYHFEASDGADVSRFPATTANPNHLVGPDVQDIGNLQSALIQPFPKGRSIDKYTFTVTYRNAQGIGPDPARPIELRLRNIATGTTTAVTMQAIDPIGPQEYTNGVRYQVQLTGSQAPLMPGAYDVSFGFKGFASGTTAQQLIVNGRPVLSNLAANPQTASQAGDIDFTVTYTDVNGDAPQRAGIRLLIDGTPVTVVPTTTPATPTAANFQAGVVYRWTVPASQFTVGSHTFQVTAQDDLEDADPTAILNFTVNAAQFPSLTQPNAGDASTNGGTVTPLSGAKSGSYTFSVKYSHQDGVAPTTINLVLDPGSANQQIIPLTTTNPGATPADFQNGVIYQTVVSNLTSGVHSYKFTATDRLAPAAGHSVELVNPATNQPFVGPTVNFVPTLSQGTVILVGSGTTSAVNAQNGLVPAVKGNTTNRFQFQVVYTDPNGAPAQNGFVKVVVNGSQEFILKPKPGDPLNYATGVVYSTEADNPTGIALTPGQKVFHFEASDGLDPARFPTASGSDITGLTVTNVAVLEKPNATGDDGTLTPRTGPLSTTFTYSIIYKNADNTAPQSVRVIIDGTPFEMVKAANQGTNFTAGVRYEYQHRFNSGTTHTYRFEAVDAESPNYIARYPADGSVINGPTVNVPLFAQPTFQPNPGLVGQPMTITGQLITSPSLGTPVSVQIIRPDGSGSTDVANTNPANGTFSYTFTPTQTGDYKVKLSWAGSTGVYDAISQDFAFRVAGYQIQLPSGTLDMVSSPLIPVTPDPSITLGVTDTAGNPLPVTVLDLIKWIPAGVNSRYARLNSDSQFPGMTGGQAYWMRPSQPVILNPRGTLWDQTQPYSIPLGEGWNQIGSVYLQDINWSAVQVRHNGQTLNIAQASNIVRPIAWGYNPTTGGYVPVSLPDGVLRTGRGYWVRSMVVGAELILNPPGSRSATISRAAFDPKTTLQVAVRSGDRSELENFVPIDAAEKSLLTLMEKPPYMDNYVTVRFLPNQTVTMPEGTRAAAAGANVVPFEVVTDRKNADVTVYFPNAANLGRRTDVSVVDLATGQVKTAANGSGVTFNTGDNTAPRKFALVLRSVTVEDRLILSGVSAQSGRGPAGAGQFKFSYTVSASATVKAQIVGATGQVVRTLDGGRSVSRGVNQLQWDGKDNNGASVPAGAYSLKLSATDDRGNAANYVLQVILAR
jgi:hypothetical protein